MGGFQCRDRMKAAGTSRDLFPEHAHIVLNSPTEDSTAVRANGDGPNKIYNKMFLWRRPRNLQGVVRLKPQLAREFQRLPFSRTERSCPILAVIFRYTLAATGCEHLEYKQERVGCISEAMRSVVHLDEPMRGGIQQV
jgi:hypothetical protein